jgi:hypothetical protein
VNSAEERCDAPTGHTVKITESDLVFRCFRQRAFKVRSPAFVTVHSLSCLIFLESEVELFSLSMAAVYISSIAD